MSEKYRDTGKLHFLVDEKVGLVMFLFLSLLFDIGEPMIQWQRLSLVARQMPVLTVLTNFNVIGATLYVTVVT